MGMFTCIWGSCQLPACSHGSICTFASERWSLVHVGPDRASIVGCLAAFLATTPPTSHVASSTQRHAGTSEMPTSEHEASHLCLAAISIDKCLLTEQMLQDKGVLSHHKKGAPLNANACPPFSHDGPSGPQVCSSGLQCGVRFFFSVIIAMCLSIITSITSQKKDR